MKAGLVFREKRLVKNLNNDEAAITEIKIWEVPVSKDYPEGRKFSLFLIANGRVLIGIDNHKPKGPHLHLGSEELVYFYQNESTLLDDFWDLVRKAGYKP